MPFEPGYKVGTDSTGLTTRQREVRDLLAEGKTGAEMASLLGISEQRIGQIRADLRKKEAEPPPPAHVHSFACRCGETVQMSQDQLVAFDSTAPAA